VKSLTREPGMLSRVAVDGIADDRPLSGRQVHADLVGPAGNQPAAHQIRVHLSARKWPIVGDAVYGDTTEHPRFPRQALHSWRVAFKQPTSGHELVIEAPLPQDMREFATAMGLSSVVTGEDLPL
ncbi:MAG: hypothetical protein RLZZ53_2718, partial [Acidobacteriota bacterium]